jgi:hypothetical protein
VLPLSSHRSNVATPNIVRGRRGSQPVPLELVLGNEPPLGFKKAAPNRRFISQNAPERRDFAA